MHLASLCLLVGAFNPFTFKVIIDNYDPVTIYFVALGSFLFYFILFFLRCFSLAFILKSILSDMSIATPAFFWSLFAWYIFFQPFTFSLYVSLVLRWVSCKQHIEGSCFCIHSASLCLLVGAFNPFTFKVIIDKCDPVTIYFIVLGSSLYTLFVFPV